MANQQNSSNSNSSSNSSSKRGLGSASKQTRERVAKMGGEASGGGNRSSNSPNS